jgi:hypothetical protein
MQDGIMRRCLQPAFARNQRERIKEQEIRASSVERNLERRLAQGTTQYTYRTRIERWHGIESKPQGRPFAIAPPSTPTRTNMDIREPFSRLKKKIKHRLTGGKDKPSRTGTDTGGERVGTIGSLPRPEPHVAGSGHDQEGSGVSIVGEQVFSTNRPPQPDEPDSVPGGESESDREGGEVDADGREGSQRNSVKSGLRRGGNDADGERVERVHPSPSAPSLVRGEESDGMLM